MFVVLVELLIQSVRGTNLQVVITYLRALERSVYIIEDRLSSKNCSNQATLGECRSNMDFGTLSQLSHKKIARTTASKGEHLKAAIAIVPGLTSIPIKVSR